MVYTITILLIGPYDAGKIPSQYGIKISHTHGELKDK
jgi:hypothetical protein